MGQIFEYFVVCGLGPEMRTLDGDIGFHGLEMNYLPSLLDQFPPSDHSLYPPPQQIFYPYLNIDAGTMSPIEHGEVYVLDDTGEVDLDLGNYERFMDIKLTRENNITTGNVYKHVLEKARRGDYLGKTVQVVPHIIDAIQEWIERASKIPVDGQSGPADVCVIELGGTIGDIESMPFIEALGQFVSCCPDIISQSVDDVFIDILGEIVGMGNITEKNFADKQSKLLEIQLRDLRLLDKVKETSKKSLMRTVESWLRKEREDERKRRKERKANESSRNSSHVLKKAVSPVILLGCSTMAGQPGDSTLPLQALKIISSLAQTEFSDKHGRDERYTPLGQKGRSQ